MRKSSKTLIDDGLAVLGYLSQQGLLDKTTPSDGPQTVTDTATKPGDTIGKEIDRERPQYTGL